MIRSVAQVVDVQPAKKGYEVVLDQTVFFPEEGGQPCDKGTIDGESVLAVKEKNGVIYHTMMQPPQVGEQVECAIDWSHRFSLMQNHSGEHVVSGLIHAAYGYDNVGFHMGSDAIPLDLNGVLTKEQVREIELKANQVVWANLPVSTMFPAPEELDRLEYRSKLDLRENVRIVQIGHIDRCACCAPHVNYTGEIGMIRLLSVQSYKGGVRISMLCGHRALEQSQMVQDQIEALGVKFSVKQDKVQQAVEKLADAHEELKAERNALSSEVLKQKAALIPECDTLIWAFEELQGEEVRIYANLLAARNKGMTAVFGKNGRFVIVSEHLDVRILAQILREKLGAKGGGSAQMVQGSVTAECGIIEQVMQAYKSDTFA